MWSDKILITGARGVLGTELQEILTQHGVSHIGVNGEVDVRDLEVTCNCVRNSDCNIVIHCAAITDVPRCEVDKQLAYNVNVLGTRNVAEACRLAGVKMVQISTDYVFRGDKEYTGDGTEGNYNIDDYLDPINYYSLTKVLAEQCVIDRAPDRLVVRLSFKKKGPWPYPKAFVDQYTSRDTVDVLARQILNATLGGLSEIVHLGTARKTVFELAQRQSPDVEPISIEDIKNVVLPRDTSLKLTEIPEVL